MFSKTETPSKTMSKNEISDWKNQFCKIFSRSDEKIFKIFLTVNQALTKKLEKNLEKNLVSSENGCIFASEIKTKKKPKNKVIWNTLSKTSKESSQRELKVFNLKSESICQMNPSHMEKIW